MKRSVLALLAIMSLVSVNGARAQEFVSVPLTWSFVTRYGNDVIKHEHMKYFLSVTTFITPPIVIAQAGGGGVNVDGEGTVSISQISHAADSSSSTRIEIAANEPGVLHEYFDRPSGKETINVKYEHKFNGEDVVLVFERNAQRDRFELISALIDNKKQNFPIARERPCLNIHVVSQNNTLYIEGISAPATAHTTQIRSQPPSQGHTDQNRNRQPSQGQGGRQSSQQGGSGDQDWDRGRQPSYQDGGSRQPSQQDPAGQSRSRQQPSYQDGGSPVEQSRSRQPPQQHSSRGGTVNDNPPGVYAVISFSNTVSVNPPPPPPPSPPPAGRNDIMREGVLNRNGVISFIKSQNPYSDYQYIGLLFDTYVREAAVEQVNYEVAVAQMLYATDFLRNTGRLNDHNYAAFAPTSRWGGAFADMADGVRAHIQHLKGYASTAPLNGPKTDPRYDMLKSMGYLGTVRTFDELFAKWAPESPQYGHEVSRILGYLQYYSTNVR